MAAEAGSIALEALKEATPEQLLEISEMLQSRFDEHLKSYADIKVNESNFNDKLNEILEAFFNKIKSECEEKEIPAVQKQFYLRIIQSDLFVMKLIKFLESKLQSGGRRHKKKNRKSKSNKRTSIYRKSRRKQSRRKRKST